MEGGERNGNDSEERYLKSVGKLFILPIRNGNFKRFGCSYFNGSLFILPIRNGNMRGAILYG